MRRLVPLLALCTLTAHGAEPDDATRPSVDPALHPVEAWSLEDPQVLLAPVAPDGAWRPVLELPDPHVPPTADEIALALEELAARAPAQALVVDPLVHGPDGLVRLEDLLPEPPPVPVKEGEALRGRPVDHPGAADGALSGKAVYLSQCHGYRYYTSLGRFSTQRGNLFDTVEDFHNPEGMNQFLAAYLENSGAAVFTAKERDHQVRAVIVDDGEVGYTETGRFRDGAGGWGRRAEWSYGSNPFRSGSTRVTDADSGAVATWTVQAPVDGTYAVYVSWDSDPGNASDAHYRITHPGGVIDRTYDQRVHGSTWQYVEQVWLSASEPLTVELIADSSDSGATLSADAVRIGGGTGVISRYGGITDLPRWEESAILATQYNGAPPSVYDPYNDAADGSDPPARSRWADWEHPQGEDALYLSWHSNATANGTARGTVTYIYEGSQGAAYAGSEDLAWAVQEEMVDAFQLNWEPGWLDRGVKRAAFAEVNPGHNNEMPAALVELAFHDNSTDINYLKHPRFRLDAARAMYRGIVRYFAERDGLTPVYLPEPPVGLSLTHDAGGELVLSWDAGPVGAPYGDAPTGYLVQTSLDGHAWSPGFAVTGTRTTLDVPRGEHVFARVVATNDGGLSFASEVVGGLRSPDGQPAVLIVDAFDRFETGQLEWRTAGFLVGDVRAMRHERINPHDIVVSHGRAIAQAGWPFDSVSDESLSELDLSRYRVVVWATGEESTVDETFSTPQQQLVRTYWEGGGALWTSGAEILWDLDEKGSASDRAFAQEVLGATLASDDAGTEAASGTDLLDGLDLGFSSADAPYPVEWPDVLDSDRPVIATYDGGGTAAILGERVALFGMPFEAIHGRAGSGAVVRAQVAERVLQALVPDYTPPEGVIDPSDTGDTDSPLVAEDPRVRIGEGRGCGCHSTGSGTGLAWLAALALLIWRRRSGQARFMP